MSGPAIFLSYARDDASAARRIAEALREAGLEVWFDENELTGGDAWDQKIRTQIAECALFVPLISANTQARLEGYFRLEWRLAEQRSHLMAKGKRFLVPVCIDDTREKGAQVPDAFMEVQWTRLRPLGYGGQARPEDVAPALAQFVELVKRLVVGGVVAGAAGPGPASARPATAEVGRRVPGAAWMGARVVVAIGIGATFFATRKPVAENAGAGTRPTTAEAIRARRSADGGTDDASADHEGISHGARDAGADAAGAGGKEVGVRLVVNLAACLVVWLLASTERKTTERGQKREWAEKGARSEAFLFLPTLFSAGALVGIVGERGKDEADGNQQRGRRGRLRYLKRVCFFATTAIFGCGGAGRIRRGRSSGAGAGCRRRLATRSRRDTAGRA